MTEEKKAPPKRKAKTLKAYKAFNNDFTCRDFKYEIGKTYEHTDDVEICSKGFHACEFPLDIFNYYSPCDSKFAIVELSGELSRNDDGDTKVAAARITIKAEIGIPEIVTDAIKWIVAYAKGNADAEAASGHSSTQAASGDYSTQAASGRNAVLVAAGRQSTASAAEGGCFALRWDDGNRPRISVGYVGENGIKPNTTYTVNNAGDFVEVQS